MYPIAFNKQIKKQHHPLDVNYKYTGEFYHDGSITWYFIINEKGNKCVTNTHPEYIIDDNIILSEN